MIPVHLLDSNGEVIVRISVATAAIWDYSYLHNGGKFQYDSSMPDKPFPHEYNLGNHNLGIIDGWEVNIENPLGKDTAYEVSVEWLQNGTILNMTWAMSGQVKAGEPADPKPGGSNKYVHP